MITEHTPGPWVAFTDGSHTNIVAVVPHTHCVFSLPGHDKNEPNVRLIAAAPELLEALQTLLSYGLKMSAKHEASAFEAARAAIAKATSK